MSATSSCPVCAGADQVQAMEQIRDVIALYQGRPGSLIQVLHLSQQIYGSLPLEVQQLVADGMGIPLSEVSGVVSFYTFFTTIPRGEHTIRVCLGTACYVRGGNEVLRAMKDKLGIDVGGTTPDRLFSLEVGRCFGACGMAPVLMVNDDLHQRVKPAKLGELLEKYRAPAAPAQEARP